MFIVTYNTNNLFTLLLTLLQLYLSLIIKHILIWARDLEGLTVANLLQKNLPSSPSTVKLIKETILLMGLVKVWNLSGTRKLDNSKTSLKRLEHK